ncbi:hypothetical protein KUCAC02_032518 [Chaenocephalus aceratus]|nr:hypothetical protein KUCAC02_033270 [Chaenocephalus aceratus]KAI4793760.1 hypothetical protein KUCAC02_032518 [Chaenocephalus aceratus]
MLCPILIAALHFNENANRVQGVTKAGEAMYSIKYPKGRTGAAVLRRVLESPTYEETAQGPSMQLAPEAPHCAAHFGSAPKTPGRRNLICS